MFSAIKYQWQVWRLNRELDRIDRRYRPAREAEKGANANPPPWFHRTCGSPKEMMADWSRKFDEPIPLPNTGVTIGR
jgi:hypothetical protein